MGVRDGTQVTSSADARKEEPIGGVGVGGVVFFFAEVAC